MLGGIISRIAQAREIRRALTLSRPDFEAWKLEKFRRLARFARAITVLPPDHRRAEDRRRSVRAGRFPGAHEVAADAELRRDLDRARRHEAGDRRLPHPLARPDRPLPRQV